MKKIFLILASMAILASCDKDNLGNGFVDSTDLSQITILAQAPGVSTKSTLGDDGFSVLWDDGDELLVTVRPNTTGLNKNYKAKSAILTTSLANASESAYFTGDNPRTGFDTWYDMRGVVFYPSNVNYEYTSAAETISFNLASQQTSGKNGSFGKDYNLAGAYINLSNFKEGSAQTVNFKNVCALIRFSLPESATDVVSVNITSTDSAIAGNANLNKENITDRWSNTIDYEIHYASSTDNIKEVTLSNEGNAFDPKVEYNVVVWPGTHSVNALTFTFTNSNGQICSKKIPFEVEFKESEIDLFKFTSELVFEDPKPTFVSPKLVNRADELEDGAYYVITHSANRSLYWTTVENDLRLTSPMSTTEFSVENVFQFKNNNEEVYGANSYNAKVSASWMSLSNQKYVLDVDNTLYVSGTIENATHFVIANAHRDDSITSPDMDSWRNDSSKAESATKEHMYYADQYIKTGPKTIAEGNPSNKYRRKWNFYKVEIKK